MASGSLTAEGWIILVLVIACGSQIQAARTLKTAPCPKAAPPTMEYYNHFVAYVVDDAAGGVAAKQQIVDNYNAQTSGGKVLRSIFAPTINSTYTIAGVQIFNSAEDFAAFSDFEQSSQLYSDNFLGQQSVQLNAFGNMLGRPPKEAPCAVPPTQFTHGVFYTTTVDGTTAADADDFLAAKYAWQYPDRAGDLVKTVILPLDGNYIGDPFYRWNVGGVKIWTSKAAYDMYFTWLQQEPSYISTFGDASLDEWDIFTNKL